MQLIMIYRKIKGDKMPPKKTKTSLKKNITKTQMKSQKNPSNRKIIAGLFISLDGVTESPNEWQETFDEEMGKDLQATLDNQDGILLGRKTYEEWKQYWPENTTDSFANYINNIQKYVVSSTLEKADWGKYKNILLIKDINELKHIKSLNGKNIGMSGSSTLVISLLNAGLVDELYLMIHPVIVGKGKRLFNDNSSLKRLKLIYSKTTSSGVIIAKYIPI